MAVGEPNTQIPSGSVIITPEDMWHAIERIEETGRRTEGAVTRLELIVNPSLKDLRGDLDGLGERLRTLEEVSWSSRWVPAIVMSLLASVAGGVVLFIITRGLAA